MARASARPQAEDLKLSSTRPSRAPNVASPATFRSISQPAFGDAPTLTWRRAQAVDEARRVCTELRICRRSAHRVVRTDRRLGSCAGEGDAVPLCAVPVGRGVSPRCRWMALRVRPWHRPKPITQREGVATSGQSRRPPPGTSGWPPTARRAINAVTVSPGRGLPTSCPRAERHIAPTGPTWRRVGRIWPGSAVAGFVRDAEVGSSNLPHPTTKPQFTALTGWLNR